MRWRLIPAAVEKLLWPGGLGWADDKRGLTCINAALCQSSVLTPYLEGGRLPPVDGSSG
jgi:hypothetical protein